MQYAPSIDFSHPTHQQLVIPKFHGAKLADIPDDQLSEILPVAKRLVQAVGADNYNILQNNGRLAHQLVDHVRLSFPQRGSNITGAFPCHSKAEPGGRAGSELAIQEDGHGRSEEAARGTQGEDVIR